MKILKLALLIIIFGSCEKENYNPPLQEPTYQTQVNNHAHSENCFTINGNWVLLDAEMYVTNLETGEFWVEGQFGSSDVGSLRYNEPLYDFEVLERGKTEWSFTQPNVIPGVGVFMLNNDTVNIYGLNVTNSNYTIIENSLSLSVGDLLLGGSSRNITPYFNGKCNRMEVVVQEVYENINGYNYYYYSILKFKKKNSIRIF